MTNFTILNLSDTHIGNRKVYMRSLSVFDPLCRDIEEFRNRGIIPSLLIFTGDLAYGEEKDNPLDKQYESGIQWINDIYKALGSSFTEIPFVIVPGNHDLDRINRDIAHDRWIDELNKDILYNAMNENNATWKNVILRQQAWTRFTKALFNSQVMYDENLNMSITKISCGDHLIGVAGLNSSWASYKDKQDSNLWIGDYQIGQALNKLSDCSFKMVVSHHPASYLNQGEREHIAQKIESNFQIYFHGHVHDQWYRDIHRHLEVAAGACYQGAEKEKAYNWLVIDFDKKVSDIYLRKFEEKGEGGWIPFVIPGKTNDEGVGRIQHLFASEKPKMFTSTGYAPSKTSHSKSAVQKPIQSCFSKLRTVEEYMLVLQDRFSFRWEPMNFSQSSDPVIVYWPIRLRRPTLIHAAQCYAAAGLQLLGAKIALFLDDFGNIETSKDNFCKAIDRWMEKVGGTHSALDVNLCTDTITGSDDVWHLLQNWFANSQVELKEVLLVSKLIRGEEINAIDAQQLIARKPRRLMSPAIVWACLARLHNDNPKSRFVTLGGYDEKKLWETWRNRIQHVPSVPICHLYIPELYSTESGQAKPLNMSENSAKLNWDAEEDIREVFKKEINNTTLMETFSPNRIIPWCFSECNLLPSFIKGSDPSMHVDNKKITTIDELKGINKVDDLITPLARNVSQWLF